MPRALQKQHRIRKPSRAVERFAIIGSVPDFHDNRFGVGTTLPGVLLAGKPRVRFSQFSLAYGCGLRAGEVVRLKVKHIDSAQKIIRIEQSKGRKDRNAMLSPEMHGTRTDMRCDS